MAAALPATDEAETALEDFLRALTGDPAAAAPRRSAAAAPEPAAVLHFQRPGGRRARRPTGDLDRLPGPGRG